MTPRYPTYGKAASTPQQPLGVWRGQVVAVNADATLDVVVPRIAGLDGVYRSLEALGYGNTVPYAIGDAVYVTFIEGRVDDLLVLGPVRRTTTSSSSPSTTVDGLVFSWPGTPLNTRVTGLYPMPRIAATLSIRFTLTAAGSTATTVDVAVNGAVAETVVLAAGITAYTYPWVRSLALGDTISMQITDPGTDAADLVAQVRYD